MLVLARVELSVGAVQHELPLDYRVAGVGRCARRGDWGGDGEGRGEEGEEEGGGGGLSWVSAR